MESKFVEVTQSVDGGFNHGKFMIGRFDKQEWQRACEMDLRFAEATTDYRRAQGEGRSLLGRCGWSGDHVLVLDLQTGEGSIFLPGGSASADLDKHKVWVCPMFEPFLEWLYGQDLSDLLKLPDLVELPDAPEAMYGYRRAGEGR